MKVEQSKLNEYLKKIHGSVCPLCGNNHWNISDQVFQAVEFLEYTALDIDRWSIIPYGSFNMR